MTIKNRWIVITMGRVKKIKWKNRIKDEIEFQTRKKNRVKK